MPILATEGALPFEPFSVTHLAVVVAHGLIMLALVGLGRVARGTRAGERLHAWWAWFVVAVQACNVLYWCTPPRLDPADSLPLHVCDLAGLVAPLALLARARVWRTVLFYWGLGLSTQAFVTPVIRDGPETVRFHLFFFSHLTIIATPLYDFFVRDYRPRWKDLALITVISMAYLGAMVALNAPTGWNYGYVGQSKPDNPTVIDKLGPWPLRLLWMTLMVHALFAILTWVACWPVWRRLCAPHQEPMGGTTHVDSPRP